MKSGKKKRDKRWQILNSCIMGFRAGKWDIPCLHYGTVTDKLAWINKHNRSGSLYTVEDWKNARRPERQKRILSESRIHKKLLELQQDMFQGMPPLLKDDNLCKINTKNTLTGLALLQNINDSTVSLAFFDPEYHDGLRNPDNGDESAEQSEQNALPQMNDSQISKFILELSRVIKPSGYLMIWIEKSIIFKGIDAWLQGTSFRKVDFLVWKEGNKTRKGARLLNTAEYLIILQKPPVSGKSTWSDHSIPDVWIEKAPQTHPQAKPLELEKRMIEAVTRVGDVVCDPCAGSYGVLTQCKKTGRIFIGSDIIEDIPHKKIRHRMDPLFSSETDEWATPRNFFDELDKEFHFTLDPCSTYQNHLCNKYFTIEDDGLTKDWSGENVWVNPPYSHAAEWAEKCFHEGRKPGTTIVLLLPSRTDTKYFHEYILNHAEIRFLEGRLKFGDSENSAPFPSLLAIYGHH